MRKTFDSSIAFNHFVKKQNMDADYFIANYKTRKGTPPIRSYFSKLKKVKVTNMDTLSECANLFGVTVIEFIDKGITNYAKR